MFSLIVLKYKEPPQIDELQGNLEHNSSFIILTSTKKAQLSVSNACREIHSWVKLHHLNRVHFKATSTGIYTLQKDLQMFLPIHFGTQSQDAFQEMSCNPSLHTHLLSIQYIVSGSLRTNLCKETRRKKVTLLTHRYLTFFIPYKHWKWSISYSVSVQHVSSWIAAKNHCTLSLLLFKCCLLGKHDEEHSEMLFPQGNRNYFRLNKASVLMYFKQQFKLFQQEARLLS